MTQSSGCNEPLAIVGIGCRLPGNVVDPQSYWDLLINKRSGIVEVPASRWSNDRFYHPDAGVPGKVISKWGGFIDGIEQFDAKFWGISPREAARMDPQQRWLLSTAWESLEDAGIVPSSLRGTATGVFVGVSSNDYGSLQFHDMENIDVHTNSGGTLSIASNRISYMLDLKGPSMSVDTACSSALTATVVACQQLWNGKCDTALAGGVNAIVTQHASIGFSKASMLSPSGQCFAFDSRADGYVRSEGAGVIVIKRLSDAIEQGLRVYALIRSAVANQDGHTSSMTVPGVESQSTMLREACADAGVTPADIGYVEAHGTGTPVGDPIEANAIGAVIGQDREEPCLMGSVKPNIGHLESGSGIAGLIKTALVVYHGTAPPNINFDTPNPNIPFDDLGLKVVEQATALPQTDGRCLAAINSFGFGGANADMILESPPAPTEPTAPVAQSNSISTTSGETSEAKPSASRPRILCFSARDPKSLRGYAQAYRQRLEDATLGALCWSAAEGRERHRQAVAVIGSDSESLRDGLDQYLETTASSSQVVLGAHSEIRRDRVAFVFTGQGAQWWAMGQQLLQREPVFRATVEAIDAELSKHASWSLITEMTRDENSSQINRTDIAQPAIFALQAGLAALWKQWGVTPHRVVGHSVGEVAAAYVAGIYSLEDAVTVIYHRSRLQNTTGGHGGMLAVGMSAREASALIGDDGARVQLAAMNSPDLVTIAGDTEPLERIQKQLEDQGAFVRRLRVNYAFHTHQMEPIKAELLEALAAIKPQQGEIEFISTVTGAPLDGTELDAEYWWKNVRHPVLFEPAVRGMLRRGDDLFLELGPHPALKSSVAACVDAESRDAEILYSLERKTDESLALATNVASLHMAGFDLNWSGYLQTPSKRVELPRYPWANESCWIEGDSSVARIVGNDHPLLGLRIPGDNPTWEFSLDPRVHTYIRDHQLWDSIVFPGAGYGEMGLAAASMLYPDAPHAVEDLKILKALFVTEEKPPTIRVVLRDEDKSYRVYSRPESRTDPWELHAEGRLVAMAPPVGETSLSFDSLQSQLPDHFGREQFYGVFTDIGFQFGRDFQHIEEVWRRQGESLSRIELSENVVEGLNSHVFHPALMDAGFQAAWSTMVVSEDSQPEDFFYLPSAVRRVRCFASELPRQAWMHCTLRSNDGKSFVCDILVYDNKGSLLAEIRGFEATKMDRGGGQPWEDCLFVVDWKPVRLAGARLEGPAHLASTADVMQAVERIQQAVYDECGLEVYYEQYSPEIHEIGRRLVEDAMAKIGWPFQPGDAFTAEEAARRMALMKSHSRLFASQLRTLVEVGVLAPADVEGRFVVKRLPQRMDASAAFASLAEKYPQYAADYELVESVVPFVADVLTGEQDPIGLMFPGGASERLDRFYKEGQDFGALNQLVREAVKAALGDRPDRRDLRILEVGAGTGSLTRSVLKVVPTDQCEYLYTDLGKSFLATAKANFGDQAFMDFRVFDVEKPPQEQGLAPGSCDVVLASNVLHATRRLSETLEHLKQCLAPGGMLIFVDAVEATAKIDNMFGLLKGWWLYEDTDLRKDSALLSPAAWKSLLADECGFVDVQAFSTRPLDDSPQQACFLAVKPVAEGTPSTAASSPALDSTDSAQQACTVVFADESGLALQAAKTLAAPVVTVRPGESFEQIRENEFTVEPTCEQSIASLFRQLAGRGLAVARIVHAWSLEHPVAEQLNASTLKSSQQTGALCGMALVKAIIGSDACADASIFTFTRLAQGADGASVRGIGSSPLIGLMRVACNEHPNHQWKMIDLGEPTDFDAKDLADEIRLADADTEVAYRNGRRFVRRVDRVRPSDVPQYQTEAIRDGDVAIPYRLQTDKPGVLANLSLNATPRSAPGPDEVEVRVQAGGINFRDVMKALGMYPGNPVDLLWFGDDFAGVVERVGANVTKVKVGDEVAGMSPYIFRSHALVNQHLLFKKPSQLSFEETATLPTVFLTAHYALNELARIRSGERILIHAGTGGVGQAAIQIAKRMGLEIFATAGTDEKRQLLRDLGADHVMNSRTLDFADQIMELTEGKGVDVVLNSLAGEFIPKSFSVLGTFGRFLEIGKIDIYNNTRLGLECLKNNISYFVIDLAQHLEHKPELVAEMFGELAQRFAASDYGPLTYKVFAVNDVVEAFRYMAQGKHVGKNVLSFDQPSISVGPCTQDGEQLRADATYLITGGAGGFGLEVAKWMVAQGAKHLALMSRSGPRGQAIADIERLQSEGVEVVDLRADVSCQDAVESSIATIRKKMPPLRGVIHGAMVLDDEFIAELDIERFNRVLDPKMLGAWNLHQATLDDDLEHFVCFSSYSAIVGSARQSNYNAGNIFLDSLAAYRRALGLPSLTINWGALTGAGFVERNEKTAEYLELVGVKPFHVREAASVLGSCLQRDIVQVGAGRMDWSVIARFSVVVQNAPTFAAFVGGQSQGGGALRPRLLAASDAERLPILEAFVANQVAGVFGIDATDVDRNASLSDLGLDSLMAVELMNRVEGELSMKVPMGKVLSGPSVIELSAALMELMGDSDVGGGESASSSSAASIDLSSVAARRLPLSGAQRVAVDFRRPPIVQVLAISNATPDDQLDAALTTLAERHPILAAALDLQDPAAPVLDFGNARLPAFETTQQPIAEITEAAVTNDTEAPFVRLWQVVDEASDGAQIVLSVSRVVADESSVASLMNELIAFLFGDSGADPASGADYRSLMQWESEATLDSVSRSIESLRGQWQGAPASLALSVSRPTGANGIASKRFGLPDELALRILIGASQRGVSARSLLQAAFATVMHNLSGQNDVLIGTGCSGFGLEGMDNVIGPLARSLPVRSQVTRGTTLDELLEQAYKNLATVDANQWVPTDLLMSEMGATGPLEQAPRVFLTVDPGDLDSPINSNMAASVAGSSWHIGDAAIRTCDNPPNGCQGDLELRVGVSNARINGWWSYDASLFDAASIARIEGLLIAAVESILSEPSRRVLESLPLEEEESLPFNEGADRILGEPLVDFEDEAQVDETWQMPAAAAERTPGRKRVLLTGATGFLGAFLLDELMQSTDYQVVCLVRADDESHAQQRVRDNLAKYQLTDADEERVSVVLGDLTSPHLGLSDEEYQRWANDIDEVYHNGAIVNLALPYRSMLPNVVATRNVLEFAFTTRAKRLHYVSTFTVMSSNQTRGQVVREDDTPPACQELLHGYAQTKWVSERMVAEAARRGLETVVYRPGHITGDSRTGASNTGDLLHTIVLASAQLGMAPVRDSQLDLTPADYVAKSIVHLSGREESLGRAFHLTNPSPLPNDLFNRWLAESEVDMAFSPYGEWRNKFVEFCSQDPTLQAVAELVAPRILDGDEGNEAMHPMFDTTQTRSALEDSGIACPPADLALLNVYMTFISKLTPELIG